MHQLASATLCLLWLSGAAGAIELTGYSPIAPLGSYTSAPDGVTVTCTDQSQIRFYVLAPDLVRVRASFGKPLPDRDHSWAIEKTAWDTPKFTVHDDSAALLISTAELEVSIQRSPLLVTFRDGATHRVINADALPMMHNPAGAV